MREIKFRCWTKEEMLYEGWNKDLFVTKEIIFRYDNVMQYTGLKVKNGKELYYGDIVKHNYNTYVVCFRENFGFCLIDMKRYNPLNTKLMVKDNWRSYQDVWGMAKYVEVIGNIYENLELLKDGNKI